MGTKPVIDGITEARTTAPGEWTVRHTPATNTLATATKAAGGAGVYHVCSSIAFTLSSEGAPTPDTLNCYVRDGATTAGDILWSATISLPAVAGTSDRIALSNLHIAGSENTAMTIEFDAAGGANTFEAVAMTGYDLR